MSQNVAANPLRRILTSLGAFLVTVGIGFEAYRATRPPVSAASRSSAPKLSPINYPIVHQPRRDLDTSGLWPVLHRLEPWQPTASLEEIARAFHRVGYRVIEEVDRRVAEGGDMLPLLVSKAMLFNYEGEPEQAYRALEHARALLASDRQAAAEWLCTVLYFQGVTALRRGENDNCIMCRGASSCIVPIAPAAIHTNPEGSRRAIEHFTEYLTLFPDDLDVKWLLNVAHMTLGEHPQRVDPRHLFPMTHWTKAEFDIGKFRDIGDRAKVNRFNQAGGAIMEDFTGDDLLDIVTSTMDATERMTFNVNQGDGTFADCAAPAGLAGQLGGLVCVQTDYNNDGLMDIFVPRGAWMPYPMRPSLLRNNGDGTFADATGPSGMLTPVNSNAASWADYDNDGALDVFVACENQPNLLYRNRGDGTFEELAGKAGVHGNGQTYCKGSAWIDFDNDGFPDLFQNYLSGLARLFRNDRHGGFTEVTSPMGVDGPRTGFSCWCWDYDNDGWLDLFATSYDAGPSDVQKGLLGQPHTCNSNRLFHNVKGTRFEDVTTPAGLNMAFTTMGSNFGDFDNDGYLDFYLGTGSPSLALLVPNRMFRNVAGQRFAEISAGTGTGHLQKGHAVACGDWDRDGDLDIFIEMGGAVNGDKYHNILFQNPGQGNNWLTVRLVGVTSNRAALGARIKATTVGNPAQTIYRHISSGSSFGANALQEHIGLAKADRVASLEIRWPSTGKTQVFRDLAANQAIEVAEHSGNYRQLHWKPTPAPK